MKKKKKIVKDSVYFCPYCKFVSKDSLKFLCKNVQSKFSFQCEKCREGFTYKNYVIEENDGKSYHCDCENINKYIEEIIMELYNKGFSQREIEERTKFGRNRIQKITSNRKYEKRISFDDFLRDHLKIDNQTILEDRINLALNYGCSVRMTRELLFTSYRLIERYRTTKDTTTQKHRRVKLKGAEVIVSYF